MGGDDKARVTHVSLAAWSPALKFTSDSSLNPETVSTELSFAFPGEISELAVCQKGKSLTVLYILAVRQYFSTL